MGLVPGFLMLSWYLLSIIRMSFMSFTAGAGTRCMSLLSSSPNLSPARSYQRLQTISSSNFLFLELLKYRKANSGFIILLTSIFTLFFFGEIRNLTTFTRLMDYNNGFSISSFFLSLLSFLWIGAQFPQEKFLSYGRILTLDYYFLLMCILLSYR